MITVITGGIGTGKSYFCKLLCNQGIAVYNCDARAKSLMMESKPLQEALSALVGKDLFHEGTLDKATLRSYITSSRENAQKVDDIVHPAVADDFLKSGCQYLESAIVFESGFNKRIHIDRTICITAPQELRIRRIIQRDQCTRQQALSLINAQMPQEEKAAMADYIIVNDGRQSLEEQIKKYI